VAWRKLVGEQQLGRGGAMRARQSEERELTSVRAGLGLALADGPILASLRAGFSRFGLFRENSARAVRRVGRKLEDKIIDSGRNKRN
jgi:hypothetical protein